MRGIFGTAVLLLSCASSDQEVSDVDLRAQVSELTRMLQNQQQLVHDQQLQIEQLMEIESRRLQGVVDSVALNWALGNITAVSSGLAEHATCLDNMWLVLCGALVMFMQLGFAMLSAGTCRAKNVQSILTKNISDVAIGTVAWFLCGWMIAYGGDADSIEFAGNKEVFTLGFNTEPSSGHIQSEGKALSWFFQWAFCSAAATIVSGGVAERVQMGGYFVYSFLMTSVIYPVVVAWTWGYGWLYDGVNSIGYMDFAGSGIVHMTGGVGAIVGAIIAGPRDGRWENPEDFAPHNAPMVVMGTFCLWFGWYGFNCGSTLGLSSASQAHMAAQVAMNTTLGASTAGLTTFFLTFLMTKGKYDNAALCNGILAGCVSVTAGCGNIEQGSAVLIGILGGALYFTSSQVVKKLKIDDPLDAFSVHGVCGAWGVMAAALFDWGKGFDHVHAWSGWECMRDEDGNCLTGAGGKLIVANLVEVLAITAWVATTSSIIFLTLKFAGFLVVNPEDQLAGLDEKHSPSKAYVYEDDAQIRASTIEKDNQA
jgi:Amt family ammonium transporter